MLAHMSITRVQLPSVPLTDQDRARDFDVNSLGMELVREMPVGPGQRWVKVRPKGAETSVTLATWFETMPAGWLTGLERLHGLGVDRDSPVRTQAWGSSVVVRDPDGNRLAIQTTTA